MWILTKLVKDKEEESGKNFRIKFGERAINETIEILLRNQGRKIEDSEEESEKLALSLSCLNFLKYASANQDMRKYLLNRHEVLKKLLYLDEQNTSSEFQKYPIEVEETWLGKNVDTLLFALTGGGATQDTLSPYNLVSFRLLQRLGDVLTPNPSKPPLLDPYKPGSNVLKELTDHSHSLFL